jgi:nucleoside transporter
MDWKLYVQLSVMMGMEYAIWGAWSPVLAARCLGPLKFSGRQTGWIYGTLFLACIFMPLVAGQIADRWLDAKWVLAAAQLAAGVLLLLASRQHKFNTLFTTMFLFSLCYAATIPLVNSVMFSQVGRVLERGSDAYNLATKNIFIWAPLAWVLVGWALTGWRRIKGTGEGNDCLIFAGFLALVMGVFCFALPATPPAGTGGTPIVKALSMFSQGSFLVFMIVSFVVTANLQFYFLGTAQYLQDIGVKSKNVPAVMAIAQVAQVVATWYALGWLINKCGYKWALAVGVLSWLALYLIYSMERPKGLVIGSMAFHGIAYVLFIIGGQMYVNKVADPAIVSSAQGLLFAVTTGLGLFVGTQFTGIVMDKFSTDGKFAWRPIYLVPCALTLASAIVLVALFRNP